MQGFSLSLSHVNKDSKEAKSFAAQTRLSEYVRNLDYPTRAT